MAYVGETLDLNQTEGSCLLPTTNEICIDVDPSVENPTDEDTEVLGDDDDEITEDWSLINLDAP